MFILYTKYLYSSTKCLYSVLNVYILSTQFLYSKYPIFILYTQCLYSYTKCLYSILNSYTLY